MLANFGSVLREHRNTKGLRLIDIADHLKFDHTYISKIETGKAPLPDLEVLLKWAFYVGAKKVIENYVISYPASTVEPQKAA
jgi:transcriptional regulator with XRE-family HTH domain